jgi:hypothetical protein
LAVNLHHSDSSVGEEPGQADANGGKSNSQLDSVAGSPSLSFSSVSIGTTVSAFGYPAAQKIQG